MSITTKQLLIGSSLAALAGGAVYLSRIQRLKANLEIVSGIMFHKVTLSGITMRIDVTMKNPSEGTVQVKFPFVRLQHQGITFASSEVRDKDFTLSPFAQTKLDPIYITLGFMQLGSTVPALLKSYRSSGQLAFDLEVITRLNNTIAYSKINAIRL